MVFGCGRCCKQIVQTHGVHVVFNVHNGSSFVFCNKKDRTIPVQGSCGLICLTGFKVLGTAQGQKSAWAGCVDMDLL